MKKRVEWQQKDLDYILQNYKTIPVYEMAKKLGISRQRIWNKLQYEKKSIRTKNKFQLLRIKKGYTLSILSDIADMSMNSLSTKERGIREFTFSEAKIISEELDITMDEMYRLLTAYAVVA